jgi:hypothetical protein
MIESLIPTDIQPSLDQTELFEPADDTSERDADAQEGWVASLPVRFHAITELFPMIEGQQFCRLGIEY